MREFAAGIDGGGTKTALLCADLEGNVILKKRFGAFNINSIGEEGLRSLLSDICDEFDKLGKCVSLCIGSAGVSNADMKRVVDDVLTSRGVEKYMLVGDHIVALEGAHDGGEGLAVIAGTGSICFGKGKDGTIERTGGWGHLIGDDGSAYGLGRDVFRECAKAMDGYGKKTVLVDLLREKKGLAERTDIIKFVYSGDKATVASVAPLVDEAYAAGDEVALEIVRRNAGSLAEQVKGVALKLGLMDADVGLVGGLVDKDTPMHREFEKVLSRTAPGLRCIVPRHDSAEGALMLAVKALRG